MAIASLSQLKGYIGVNDSSRDTELQLFLDAAEEDVIGYLGYDPQEQTYTDEHHYGTGEAWLYTKARPIQSVSSFTVNDSAWDVSELVLRDTWIDTRGYVIPEGWDVEVTYVAGYATIPSRIQLATLKIAALADMQHGRTGSLGVDNRTDSTGGSVTFGGQTVEEILDSIVEYRRVSAEYGSRYYPRYAGDWYA